MNKFTVIKLAIPLLIALAIGYAVGPLSHAAYAPGSTDPCGNAQNYQFAPVSIAAATTTRIIPLVSGQQIYVCGLYLNSVGGTSTIEYGLSTLCSTPTVAISGAYAAASTVNNPPTGKTQFISAASNAMCILSGSSTTATNGEITYVQQ